MKTKSKLLMCLMSFGCLVSCTSVNKNAALNENFMAKQKIIASTQADLIKANRPDQYYEIARQYQKNGNYSNAVIAYQKSLQLDPTYVKSITGLASVFADQKLYVLAIPLFEQVTNIEPNVASYNNLGYAYYLNKQYTDSHEALSQAILLDPSYNLAKKNLDMVVAIQTPDIAVTTITYDTAQAPIADNSQSAEVSPAILEQRQFANIDAGDAKVKNRTRMTQIASGIFELNINFAEESNMVTLQPNPQNLNMAAPVTLTALSGGVSLKYSTVLSNLFDANGQSLLTFKNNQDANTLEIVNGNGVKGIAKVVAEKMKENGLVGLKVSDAKSFNYAKTFIQYKQGYRDDAVNLNHSLVNKPYIVLSNNLPKGVSLRLVLGKDLIAQTNNTAVQQNVALGNSLS